MINISQLCLEEKIAQLLIVGFYGDSLNQNPEFINELQNINPGGVILFNRVNDPSRGNISSPHQMQNLTSQIQSYSQIPAFIALDQEGGKVSRLDSRNGFHDTSSAQKIGTENNNHTTSQWAEKIALDLSKAGINLNLAPVVDLNVYPQSPAIGKQSRCFSALEEIVSQNAHIFCQKMSEHKIYNCLKHFPGHGSARSDSHLGFTDITETWQERELQPYIKLFDYDSADMVMVCHVFHQALDSVYPASLSYDTVQILLRKKLGWQKVVITDDLQMKAISNHYKIQDALQLAINAGNDLLIIANNDPQNYYPPSKLVAFIKELVIKGNIPVKRINQCCRRILLLKEKYLL